MGLLLIHYSRRAKLAVVFLVIVNIIIIILHIYILK